MALGQQGHKVLFLEPQCNILGTRIESTSLAAPVDMNGEVPEGLVECDSMTHIC